MAGEGKRFLSKYSAPKYLIFLDQMPMFIKAIQSCDFKGKYFLIIKDNEFKTQISENLTKNGIVGEVILIDQKTNGPAETCLKAEREVINDEELIVMNCDQVMNWSSENFLHTARKYDGAIVTYHADTKKNSYAKINKNNEVLEIKEKEVISNVSLNGIHYWKKARYFFDSVKKMMLNNDLSNNEYYVGPSFNYMIREGLKVGIYHIPNEQHWAVGTPDDLEKYINKKNENLQN